MFIMFFSMVRSLRNWLNLINWIINHNDLVFLVGLVCFHFFLGEGFVDGFHIGLRVGVTLCQ